MSSLPVTEQSNRSSIYRYPGNLAAIVSLLFTFIIIAGIVFSFLGQFFISLVCALVATMLAIFYILYWHDTLPDNLRDKLLLLLALPLILLLFFVILIVTALLFLPDNVAANSVTTNLSPTSTTVGANLNGQLTFDPSSLVAACSVTKKVPVDIVLIIDTSGSMGEPSDNPPIDQAKAGANEFVQDVDFSNKRVALVTFSDDAALITPGLTNDSATANLEISSVPSPNGSTATSTGLSVAQQTLATPPTTDTLRVIILLTDGYSNPGDPYATVAAAAKKAGIRIITIGLGSDVDSNALSAIATTPGDFYRAPTPRELAGIYRDVANNINKTIATNVNVVMPYSSDFNIDEASLSPAGQVVSDTVEWHENAIGAAPTTFHFTAAPQSFGFHPLNDQSNSPQVTLTDCKGTNVAPFLGGVGPTVFAMFPLVWLLIPMLFAALANLYFLSRADRTRVREQRVVGPHPDATRVPANYNWLTSIGALSEGQMPAPEDSKPVSLIGFGEFGGWCLTQIKRRLISRYGRVPDSIRLLHITLNPTPKTDLDDNETLILSRDLTRLRSGWQQDRASASRWERPDLYLSWWDADTRDPGRAAGRLGVYIDMAQGFNNSLLLDRLRRPKHSDSRIMLLASLEEPASSALIDVAAVARYAHTIDHGADAAPDRVEALLMLPAEQRGNMRFNEQVYAALQEVERFSLGQHDEGSRSRQMYRFRYTSRTDIIIKKSPIDYCYMMNAVGDRAQMEQGSWSAAVEVAALLCDSQVDGAQRATRANLNKPVMEMNESGNMPVTSFGVYSRRIPVGELRRAVEYRLLLDALFVNSNAIAAANLNPLKKSWQLLPANIEAKKEALSFMRGSGMENRDRFWEGVADAVDSGWANAAQRISMLGRLNPNSLGDVFTWALEEKALQLLNADSPTAPHGLGLNNWLVFLEELKSVLASLRNSLFGQLDEPTQTAIIQTLDRCQPLVEASLAEAGNWRDTLIGRASAISAPGASSAPSLRQTLEQSYQNARAVLDEQRLLEHQSLILTDTLEDDPYKQVSASSEKNLLEHIGWVAEANGGKVLLRLMLIRPGLGGSIQFGPGPLTYDQIKSYDYEGRLRTFDTGTINSENALISLRELAIACSNSLTNQVISAVVDDNIRSEVTSRAVHQLKWDTENTGKVHPVIVYDYVAASEPDQTQQIASGVANILYSDRTPSVAKPNLVSTPNLHRWALLREVAMIDLGHVDTYVALRDSIGKGVDEASYTFNAGVTASKHERVNPSDLDIDSDTLNRSYHQSFTRLLERPLFAITFARAWLYGLLDYDPDQVGYNLHLIDTIARPPVPRTLKLQGSNLLSAMEDFCIESEQPIKSNRLGTDDIATLQGIEAAIRQQPQSDEYRKAIETLAVWSSQNNKGMRELVNPLVDAGIMREADAMRLSNNTALLTAADELQRERYSDLARFILAVAEKSANDEYDHLSNN